MAVHLQRGDENAADQVPDKDEKPVFQHAANRRLPAADGRIIKVLPVKSSLPAMSTMARPPGNTRAPRSLATDAFWTVAGADCGRDARQGDKHARKNAHPKHFGDGQLRFRCARHDIALCGTSFGEFIDIS
jgi:hypothetical protein